MVTTGSRRRINSEGNRLKPEDRGIHDWYRFVLSFPPHLVRTYLTRFGMDRGHTVLDPFCGTGTTLVECKKLGIASIGVESNPMAWFASTVKTGWDPNPDDLLAHATAVARQAMWQLDQDGLPETDLVNGRRLESRPPIYGNLRALDSEAQHLLLTDSISPLPLHRALTLLACLEQAHDERFAQHERLALANTLVYAASNLTFGPEVGVGPLKSDAPVVEPWLNAVSMMCDDLRAVQPGDTVQAAVFHADSRSFLQALEPQSVDAVITSPPYPNEKDYTRTTRLESVLLGFIRTRKELQALKRGLVRSNTRGVYKGDDDDLWVADHPEIQRIAAEIEARRVALGKTSGFERMYPRVTKLYFGGMARHLAELRRVLRPGAQLAYVVGDQASYLRIMIRTGTLLADIARSLGYEVSDIDLFRTRMATATRAELREEVVVLRWPGVQAVDALRPSARCGTGGALPATE